MRSMEYTNVPASQDPGPFRDDVEECLARTILFHTRRRLAFLQRCMSLETMATNTARFISYWNTYTLAHGTFPYY